jgi:hypothetical protein
MLVCLGERAMGPRSAWKSEFQEVVWLASVVSGLSVLGVGLAVGLAFALDHWASVAPVLGHA